MSRRRRRLFLALTVLLVVFLTEVSVRATYVLAGKMPPTADRSLELEWEWAKFHLKTGRAVEPGDFVFDARLGWRLGPNVKTPRLTTNAQGIRDDREIALDPGPGERRIALVGDSFTFGDGNADHETFGWYLQESLGARATVLNFGVPSYGTDQAVLMFEEQAIRFKPRVVVLGFFLQDYQRNVLTFRDYAKPMFVLDGAGLRVTNVPIIPPETLYDEYVTGQRRIGGVTCWTLGAAARAWEKLSVGLIRERAPTFVVLARLMERFQKAVKDAGAEPIWMILPNDDSVYDEGSRWHSLEGLVLAHAGQIGLRSFSVTPALRAFAAASPANEIFQTRSGSGHLRPDANRVVARELERVLREASLVPP
jgi:hypothetical protein